MNRKGIDVSTWQGSIDWQKVKASGIEFAMIRSSYGKEDKSRQTDKQFHENMKGAKAAGILCGAYHYSYATSVAEAKQEAAFFLDIIKDYSFEFPVAFDIEDKCQRDLGRQLITDMIVAFCDTVERAGYFVSLYTNLDWLNNRIDLDRVQRFDIWLAQWADKPTFTGSYGMWQYTSNGSVPGISGRVDMDIAYKDYAALIKQGGSNKAHTEQPTPAPSPAPAAPYAKGDKVKVKQGAKDYNGGGLAPHVYQTVYTVLEAPKGDRVVIGINGAVTAAVAAANLSKASTAPRMREGAKVKYSGTLYADSYGGGPGQSVSGTYTVSRYISGRKCGVLLGSIGWVPEAACKVIG